jgi:hypothetical protein
LDQLCGVVVDAILENDFELSMFDLEHDDIGSFPGAIRSPQ